MRAGGMYLSCAHRRFIASREFCDIVRVPNHVSSSQNRRIDVTFNIIGALDGLKRRQAKDIVFRNLRAIVRVSIMCSTVWCENRQTLTRRSITLVTVGQLRGNG